MKNLLVVLMVLSMATLANAGVVIGVNGQIPTGDIVLMPSETAVISIISDGLSMYEHANGNDSDDIYLIPTGPATLDISHVVTYLGAFGGGAVDADWTDTVGDIYIGLANIGVPDWPIPQGVAADGIVLHCEGPGDVLLRVIGSADGYEYDTQVIHQIPEPMTLGLLAFGSLFLRRHR
jgi:hypothetical protein